MAATVARIKEYQENSAQFCKRLFDYLDITFKHQVSAVLPLVYAPSIFSYNSLPTPLDVSVGPTRGVAPS